MSSLIRTAARSPTGRFALRVFRDLGNLTLVDRAMTLAAHAFTSIIPMLIVVGAVRSSIDARSRPIIAQHLGLSEGTAEILDRSLPGGAQELRATGVVGAMILVIAATSFARALERSLRAIWHAPSVSIRFAWRWFVVIGLVLVGLAALVALRTVMVDAGLAPVLEFALEASVWGGLWWIACWIAVNRRVGLGRLLPGALLAGIGFAVAGQIGRLLLPQLLADAALRFGVLGMAFTYIGWLLVLASILLVSAVIGRVAYITYAGTAWSRSSNRGAR